MRYQKDSKFNMSVNYLFGAYCQKKVNAGKTWHEVFTHISLINDDVKTILKQRYDYLYDNVRYLIAFYIHEQPKGVINKRTYQAFGDVVELEDRDIFIENFDSQLLNLLENFLLSEVTMEETKLYALLEALKSNQLCQKQLQEKLCLSDDYCQNRNNNGLSHVLMSVKNYVLSQSTNFCNKTLKIYALDEYIKVANYRNMAINENVSYNAHLNTKLLKKHTDGETFNPLILALSQGDILTIDEIQAIYLSHHEVLPWNLYIKCSAEPKDGYNSLELNGIDPCGQFFKINEDAMFVKPTGNGYYKYYQMCPHCGYIACIPKEILPKGVRDRIEHHDSKMLTEALEKAPALHEEYLRKKAESKILVLDSLRKKY